MKSPIHTKIGQYKRSERILRVFLALLAAHIIVVNGTDQGIFGLLLTPAYYLEMAFSFTVALLIVTWVSYISSRLDRTLSWADHFGLRFWSQLGLGMLVPALFEFVMVALYFWLGEGTSVLDRPFMYNEFRMVMLMVVFFNLYCTTRYLYIELKVAEKANAQQPFLSPTSNYQGAAILNDTPDYGESDPAQQGRDTFMVHALTRSYPIATDEIAYFYRDQGHVFIRSYNGADELISQSLDQVESTLDGKQFFRVARHMLVSHKSIVDYRPLTFGKLQLTLSLPYKEPVRVSKVSAHNFRIWMER